MVTVAGCDYVEPIPESPRCDPGIFDGVDAVRVSTFDVGVVDGTLAYPDCGPRTVSVAWRNAATGETGAATVRPLDCVPLFNTSRYSFQVVSSLVRGDNVISAQANDGKTGCVTLRCSPCTPLPDAGIPDAAPSDAAGDAGPIDASAYSAK